ncbi:MAG: hypothetical protein ABR915_10685 [Thermoguttaceae bacterium]|jgi:hypothetical protein
MCHVDQKTVHLRGDAARRRHDRFGRRRQGSARARGRQRTGPGPGRRRRNKTLDLVARTPVIYEYYNPHTGDGLGSKNYGWTAALYIDLVMKPE